MFATLIDAVLIEERFANPETLRVEMFEIPKTLSDVKTPTDVMLGCAPAVTTRAALALATLPTRFEELMFERPEALPVNKFEFRIPDTVRPVKTPTDVMLGCAPAVTTRAALALATLPTRFEEFRFERPDAFPV
jgi:hypothetical protein